MWGEFHTIRKFGERWEIISSGLADAAGRQSFQFLRPNPNTTEEFYAINNRGMSNFSDLGTHRAESSNRNNL